MSSLESCVNTLVAVSAIDDETVTPLGIAALAAYEAAAPYVPAMQIQRLKLLGLEFIRLSEPTFTALLMHTEIEARIQSAHGSAVRQIERATGDPERGRRVGSSRQQHHEITDGVPGVRLSNNAS